MRIAVLHDFFAKPGLSGGGERLAMLLANTFKADVYTGFVDKEFRGLEKLSVTEVSKKSFRGINTIKIMSSFEKLKLDYDFFIFSGTNCITAAKNNKPNILYMHTPPRYIYDLMGWYTKNTNITGKIGLWFLRRYAKPKDQFYVRQFNRIVTNSENVRKRILKYYGKEVYDRSRPIYSFVDVKKYKNRKSEDYFVSNARLDPLKRVDIIVKAFCKMPEKRLTVLSTGAEEEKIKKLTKTHENISMKGWVSEKEMIDIISRCIATIQMPIDEDLGLGALESMACGKPCIGANEGGLTETIIKGKTGLLIQPNEENLINAVRSMTIERSSAMKRDCLRQARRFSKERFIKSFKKEVNDTLAEYKKNTAKDNLHQPGKL